MKRYLTIVLVLMAAGCSAAGDFVTEVWGNAKSCHHERTLKVEGRTVEFDLSNLPKRPKIHRAILRADFQRRGYTAAVRICPLPEGSDEPAANAEPLALIAPWYRSFDATKPLREWAKKAKGPFRLYFKSAPGWRRQSTTLEIAYEGQADQPSPRVTGLRAVHHNGQTFLTWKEHEDIMAGEEPVTIEKLENKLLPLRAKQEVAYRVYAHDEPITIRTIGQAELVAEVPFVLSAYYLDIIRTIEHPNRERGEGSTPFIGGARARRDPLPRYVIAEGEEPLARGNGLYVRAITRPGKTYYAVIAAVNGREAVGRQGLSGQNSLTEPVTETAAPPGPVLQRTQPLKPPPGEQPHVLGLYNFWLEFPYVNVPRQLQVAANYPEKIDPAKKMPLYVMLGAYGGQPAFYARGGGGEQVVICPPYDQDDSMCQGRHECLYTLKTYDQGVVHNWAQRRSFALIEWAKRQWPVDAERVTLRGQFCCWALRYPEVFTAVLGDAYGNMSKSREAQKHGPTWGPYPRAVKNWAGVDHWEWINLCKYVRENPTKELPYYVSFPYSASHVGDMGPWAWQELYRALHDTKRAFTARWGNCWAGAPAAIAMAGDIKLHQSLPAFGNCSLDDNPGDGAFDPGAAGSDGDPTGEINGYLFWETETIVDEPDRWEMTVYLYDGDQHGRGKAPQESCTVDLTPRRCQKFTAKPGQEFRWSNTSLKDNKLIKSGTAKADQWGLVTIKGLVITKAKNRITIQR
jgi:hypothetical protein